MRLSECRSFVSAFGAAAGDRSAYVSGESLIVHFVDPVGEEYTYAVSSSKPSNLRTEQIAAISQEVLEYLSK